MCIRDSLQVSIDEELYKQLVAIAPQIYGTTKGSLSYAVEEALRYWLYPRAHTSIHRNPRPTIAIVFAQVVQKLREFYNFTPKEVPEYELDQAIAEVRGSDPRTIDKWKSAFLKSGLIKYIGGIRPKRIVELVGAMASP